MASLMQKFKKRKSTLKKKAGELQTLCDVEVCMVCFGPDGEDVITWPENKAEVYHIVNQYKLRKLSERSKDKGYKHKSSLNLLGFLENKRLKLEEKLKNEKTQKQSENIIGNLFSSWEARLSNSSEEEVVALCNRLDSKLQTLREKIKLLEKKAIQVHNNGRNIHHITENTDIENPLSGTCTNDDWGRSENFVSSLGNFSNSFSSEFGYENFGIIGEGSYDFF